MKKWPGGLFHFMVSRRENDFRGDAMALPIPFQDQRYISGFRRDMAVRIIARAMYCLYCL